MESNQKPPTLGARIRLARQSMPAENGRAISQETFSDKVGVHWVTVSCWERNKYPPTVDNLKTIARLTGKPVEFFTDDDEGEQPAESDEEAAELMAALAPLAAILRAQQRRADERIDAALRAAGVQT